MNMRNVKLKISPSNRMHIRNECSLPLFVIKIKPKEEKDYPPERNGELSIRDGGKRMETH